MKTIFSVRQENGTSVNIDEIFSSENEEEAKGIFEKETALLTPVDVKGWTDNDKAWGYMYRIMLDRMVIDEDDEIIEWDTLAESVWFEGDH